MHRLRFVAAVLFAPAALAGQASKSTSSPATLSALDAKSAHYAGVAKQIWGFAELGYQEYKSSALLRRELATAGFKVDSGVAGMPTAFIANYGSGKPVIAIVGEFDALPGLSQDALPGDRCSTAARDTAADIIYSAPRRWRRRSR